MIHGPVAFVVPFIATCMFAVLELLSIWWPRLDRYLWLVAICVVASSFGSLIFVVLADAM